MCKVKKVMMGEPCNISGHPPNSAEHIYCFEQYLDAFYHPSPTVRSPTGGTLPIAAPSITAKLQGIYY